MATARDGIRKRCNCGRKAWTKGCKHPWWFGFTWAGVEHRFSLHKVLDKPNSYAMSYTEALQWRDHFRAAIRAGTFTGAGPVASTSPAPDRLTFNDLADRYLREYVRTPNRRPQGLKTMELHVAALRRIEIIGPGGRTVPLGERILDSIRGDDVEAVRAVWRAHKPRDKGGEVGANRLLARLRHMFNWAILRDLTDRTPFRKNGVNTIKLTRGAEAPRTRRLNADEEERLLSAANPNMRDIIIAALETGCRIGELLSLQFGQIDEDRNLIVLPASKTKVGAARVVPMTARLRKVIDSRRHDPAGEPFGPEHYVFGNRVGEKTKSIKTAWENTRRRACVVGLHIHDLRRETGSRLLESPGVALHDVAAWLGHSSVTTTAKYLATNPERQLQTLRRFEGARSRRIPHPPTSASDERPDAQPTAPSE